jgi:hypothetical protein
LSAQRLPRPSRVASYGVAAGQADGMFRQFEPFDLETFMSRANWGVVAGLGTLLFLLLMFGFVVSAAATSPVG